MAEVAPLIYTDTQFVDRGAVISYGMDLAFGQDEQSFEISFASPKLSGGELLYIDGTEYGGIVDSVVSSTNSDLMLYRGRTWHGMLSGKILSPDAGADYLIVSGDANAVLAQLIQSCDLSAVLSARETASGINIRSYQFARFVNAYDGIQAMLTTYGAKLRMRRQGGTTELWAEPVEVIANQADSDLMDFALTQNIRVPNHLICMGEGELKDRIRVDLYADAAGNVSQTQTLYGTNEIAAYYNYSGATREELIADGTKELKGLQSQGGVDASVAGRGDWHVGDILEARDNRLGVTIQSRIVKKIVKVELGAFTTEYEVGQSVATSTSITGGEGGEGKYIAYTAGPGITITGSQISADVTQDELDATNRTLASTTTLAGNAQTLASDAYELAEQAIGATFLNAYPVGSYYFTSDITFDPAEHGGTWESVPGLGPITWHRTA